MNAAILAEAKRIWNERERTFPKFVRQSWEQGTTLARVHALVEAERRLERQGSLFDQTEAA